MNEKIYQSEKDVRETEKASSVQHEYKDGVCNTPIVLLKSIREEMVLWCCIYLHCCWIQKRFLFLLLRKI